jgi:hypothetical protein
MADIKLTTDPPSEDGFVETGDVRLVLEGATVQGHEFVWTAITANSPTPKAEAAPRAATVTLPAGHHEFQVAVTAGGSAIEGSPFTIALDVKAEDAPPAGEVQQPEKAEALLVYSKSFAWMAGIATAVIVGALGWLLFQVMADLHDRITEDSDDLSVLLGGLIGVGLVLIGAVALGAGVYGGLLEVRGRLRTKKDLEIDKAAKESGAFEAKGAEEALKGVAVVVDAVGKLRGASLILVVACVPLVAAAWIGHAAVDQPTPATTTTTTTSTTTTLPPAQDPDVPAPAVPSGTDPVPGTDATTTTSG